MAAEHYLATDLAPSILTPLEPSPVPVRVGVDWGTIDNSKTVWLKYNPKTNSVVEMRALPSTPHAAVERTLGTTVYAVSTWFNAIRSAINRERERQRLFRVEHNLPKKARLPYQKPDLDTAEAMTAVFCENVLRCLYGETVSDYARAHASRAVETGDLRAFKIRVIFIKARDSLLGSSYLPDFINGMEDAISKAEACAGCIPDPSPRRLSRAEQEYQRECQRKLKARVQKSNWRKRKKEERQDIVDKHQPKLNLQLESNDPNGNQDIDRQNVSKCLNQTQTGPAACVGSAQKPVSFEHAKNGIIKRKSNPITKRKSDRVVDVTVTSVTVTPNQGSKTKNKLPRKTRTYNTVEEILADLGAGLIAPYETVEEICADVQANRLTQEEAVLFTLALDQLNPMDGLGVDKESVLEMDRTRVEEEEEGETLEDDLEDGEAADEEERPSRRGQPISYNPQGFGGCSGHYSGSGMDWNPEDD